MSDIEQRLREAMDGEETPAEEFSRLIIEVNEGDTQTRTEAWNLIADFACEHADTIIRGFSAADTIASLRSKLEEAEGALEPFAFGDSDIADILWGNLPDDASMKTTAPLGAYRRARRTIASLREADHA